MEEKEVRKKEQLVAFGKHVRDLRSKRGLTGVGFAELLGVDKQFLSRIELGQSEPRLTTLIRLAQALDMTLAEFLMEMEYPPAIED